MISVMIPTRKRVKSLDRALHSIRDMSSSEEAVEVLLRCDDDDQETIAYLEGVKRENHNLQVLVGPRKDGYKSIPSFMNEMAAVAKGKILMCCNDDVVFMTKDWDKIIEDVAAQYKDGIFDIGVDSILNAQYFVFSIISKRWFEMMGYVHDTRVPFTGGKYFKDISDAFGRSPYVPEVIVEHDWGGYYHDATNNEAKQWLSELVAKPSGRWTESYQEQHNAAVAEAIAKLRPHLDPRIKPIIAEKGLCFWFERMKPRVEARYVYTTCDTHRKPRLLSVRIVRNKSNKSQLFIGRFVDIPKPGIIQRILEWPDDKPLIKTILIRIGARFILSKIRKPAHP